MYFNILNISVEAVSYINMIEIRNIQFISLKLVKHVIISAVTPSLS
jgi:hypothetical protein